ncbi:MAG: hypothetical protein ABI721_05175 [Candidatus Dojkabacteria bacterium]
MEPQEYKLSKLSSREIEKLTEGIVLDVKRSFDSTIIVATMMLIIAFLNLRPMDDLSEIQTRFNISFPFIGLLLINLIHAVDANLGYSFKRKSNTYKEFIKELLKDQAITADEYVRGKEKLSTIHLIIFVRSKLDHSTKDFDDEFNSFISWLIKN